MASHIHYWSCTKFANWLRGTPKPSSATSQGWGSWRKSAQAAHPIRYWLADTGLDYVQDVIYWPVTKLYDVKYYINNRWVTRSHSLTAHARDIKPGSWHDVGNRFLPCLFNELVNFVEVEQAWHHIAWDKDARTKYKAPFYATGWFRWRTWRCPQAGLDYLDWAGGLKMDEQWISKDDPSYGKFTPQAIAAQEIKALYLWWTQIHPNRPDPYDESGWTLYCESRKTSDPDDFMGREDSTESDRIETKTSLDKLAALEKQYDEEDEEMLIRLIRIRSSLWT